MPCFRSSRSAATDTELQGLSSTNDGADVAVPASHPPALDLLRPFSCPVEPADPSDDMLESFDGGDLMAMAPAPASARSDVSTSSRIAAAKQSMQRRNFPVQLPTNRGMRRSVTPVPQAQPVACSPSSPRKAVPTLSRYWQPSGMRVRAEFPHPHPRPHEFRKVLRLVGVGWSPAVGDEGTAAVGTSWWTAVIGGPHAQANSCWCPVAVAVNSKHFLCPALTVALCFRTQRVH